MHAPLRVLAALLPLCLCGTAVAEAGDPLTDRFSLSAGTFLVTTGTKVRLDSDAGLVTGSEIDVERDLGVGDRDSGRVDGYWRFAERHKIRLMYFDTSRSASRQTSRDIVFGDTTYPVNIDVETRFSTTVAEVAYEYAFLRRDTYELAGSVGVHNIRFDLGLSATSGGASASRDESAHVDGPLPVVGLHGVWRLGEKFHLDAQAQFFSLNVGAYDGHLEDYNVSLVWMPLKHLGIGAGYNDFVTRVDVDASRFNGRLRWHYGGARLFATMSF